MKHLRQWLAGGVTVVAMLLFLALTAGWVRSYWVLDVFAMPGQAISRRHLAEYYYLFSAHGQLRLVLDPTWDNFSADFGIEGWEHDSVAVSASNGIQEDFLEASLNFGARDVVENKWLGFEHRVHQLWTPYQSSMAPPIPRGGMPSGLFVRQWAIPYWFLTPLAGLIAFSGVRAFIRRWRRIPAGYCQACGYDLRGTPVRCPECGAVSAQPV